MTIITTYTQILSKPGETFWYQNIDLCDACRAKRSDCTKIGRVYNAACADCGATDMPPPDHTIDLVDGLWELTIDGLYHSRHDRQVDAENARDEYRHYQLTHRSPKELMDLFGAAYRTAKADGRLLDAARYRQSFDAAFAAHLGIPVEQMREEREICRAERKAA